MRLPHIMAPSCAPLTVYPRDVPLQTPAPSSRLLLETSVIFIYLHLTICLSISYKLQTRFFFFFLLSILVAASNFLSLPHTLSLRAYSPPPSSFYVFMFLFFSPPLLWSHEAYTEHFYLMQFFLSPNWKIHPCCSVRTLPLQSGERWERRDGWDEWFCPHPSNTTFLTFSPSLLLRAICPIHRKGIQCLKLNYMLPSVLFFSWLRAEVGRRTAASEAQSRFICSNGANTCCGRRLNLFFFSPCQKQSIRHPLLPQHCRICVCVFHPAYIHHMYF